MAAANVPQEIVDLIIDSIPLDRDLTASKQLLSKCTLVSRSFGYHARRRLFTSVTLSSRNLATTTRFRATDRSVLRKRIADLVEILETPQVGSLLPILPSIREVVVEVGLRSQHLLFHTHRMPEEFFDMHRALRALNAPGSMVHTLRIAAAAPYTWENTEAETSQALTELCQSPHTTSVYLTNIISFPLNMLLSSPSLQNLHINRVKFSTVIPPSPTGNSETSLKNLDTLSIDGYQDAAPGLFLSSFTFKILKTFVRDEVEALAAAEMIQASYKVLETLELTLNIGPGTSFLKNLSLRDFPLLNTLRLNVLTGTQEFIPSLTNIFSFVYPPTGTTGIRNIEFSIEFSCLEQYREMILDPTDDSWRLLNPERLSKKHSYLRSVKITVDFMVLTIIRGRQAAPVKRAKISTIAELVKEKLRLAVLSADSPDAKSPLLTISVVGREDRTYE